MNPFSARYTTRILPQIFNRAVSATSQESSKTSQNSSGASWGKGALGVVGAGMAVWACGDSKDQKGIRKDFLGLNGGGLWALGRVVRCESYPKPLGGISVLSVTPQLMNPVLVQIQLKVQPQVGSPVRLVISCPDIKRSTPTTTRLSLDRESSLLNQWLNTVISTTDNSFAPIKQLDSDTIRKIFEEKDPVLVLKHAELFPNQEILKLILEIKAFLLEKAVSWAPLIDTLNTHLQSKAVQKNYEDQSIQPSLETLFEIRADSSGLIHKITAEAIFLGIDVTSIERDYYDLGIMKKCTAKCVEYSKGILSHHKIVSKIEKKVGSDSADNIRNTVAFNAVQIIWQRTALRIDAQFLLGSAFLEVQDAHNQLMSDFFSHKKALYKKIEKESLLLTVSEENLLKKDLRAILEKKHKNTIQYVSILEKYLAQPWEDFVDVSSTSERK